jgi:hypothetical protein
MHRLSAKESVNCNLTQLRCATRETVYLQAGNVARYTELMERSSGRLGPPDR